MIYVKVDRALTLCTESSLHGRLQRQLPTAYHMQMPCSIGSSYHVPVTSFSPLRRSPPSLYISPPRSRQINRQLVIRSSTSSRDTGFPHEFPDTSYRIFKEEVIGAEYGEGFESFRQDGIMKVDVDFLNNRLQEGFLQRIRYSMKPDEAYGLIFSWDNVVVDGQALRMSSLRRLAFEEGKELPRDADIGKYPLYERIDDVLHQYFDVERRDSKWNKLKARLWQLYYENLSQLQSPVDGLVEWLDAVATSHIPCAVVSTINRWKTLEVLEHFKIKRYFQAIVTEEDDMESLAHRLLSAAVKLNRKPSRCVAFEDDPRGITAAHNCTMMAIGLIGVHPAYNLRQADITVSKFGDLSVINLRRLFAREGFTFMDPQKQSVWGCSSNTKLAIERMW